MYDTQINMKLPMQRAKNLREIAKIIDACKKISFSQAFAVVLLRISVRFQR